MFTFLIKKLFKKNNEYETYNLKINWTAGSKRDELMEVIKQYPQTFLANQSEDFNGMFLFVGVEGLVFHNEDSMLKFMKDYGKKYGAKRIKEQMSLEIKSF